MLFARNEEINQFLGDNPLILGGLAIVLALVLAGAGVGMLLMAGGSSGGGGGKKGKRRSKGSGDGSDLTFKVVPYILFGFGGLVLLFGLFKIVTGLIAPQASGS